MDLHFSDTGLLWRIASSAGLGLAAIAIIVWLGLLRRRLAKRAGEAAPASSGKRPPGGFAHWLVSLAILCGAIWIVLTVWDLSLSDWLPPQAGPILGGLGRVLLVASVAAAGLELTNFAARHFIQRMARRNSDRRRLAKLHTITPLISGLANAIIVIVATAMALSEVGIQIAPLLAGAGVAGIAIGFGAQSLVKDLFTGAFLIIEDIVSHGDVVEISGVTGVVEAMTLRTIRVRSYDGTLHIFPYGEAPVIHNKTSRFSCFAFELQISYLSDIGVAMDTLIKVGEEIRRDKELASSMLGSLELSGVDKLHDNGVILKGRIRTIAGENARVGSAFLKLAKERLDAAGVLIAHRHLPVPPFEMIKDQVASPLANSGNDRPPASH
jgi:moderate conductance mechanosensitive channel